MPEDRRNDTEAAAILPKAANNGGDTSGDTSAAPQAQPVKWTRTLALVAIASTFGTSVPVGYTIGVINAPAVHVQAWCNETLHATYGVVLSAGQMEVLWATIVSIFLVGGMVASLAGAWIADRVGRKGALLTCYALFIVGAVFFYFCRAAGSVEMLLIGRLVVGLASGLTLSVLSMYMTELAPLALRGTLGVLCSMGVTGGVVVGQVGSLQEVFGTAEHWHIAFAAYGVLSLVCALPAPWFPESPKFLYIVAQSADEAKRQLLRLRDGRADVVAEELAQMRTEANSEPEKRTLWSVLRDGRLTLPVVLVCSLLGGQQLSGINAVFYYSVSIFEKAGLSHSNAQWANLGAGCINLLVACFSPVLMSKVNRRPLLLWSCAVSGVFLIVLTFIVHYIDLAAWLPFACIFAVFGYIIAYQFGLGPIPYFIGSELFESAPRPAAMSLGSLSSWTCNFIIGMSFPSLQNAWGAFVFLPFACVCFAMVALAKFYLPETRGRESSEIAPLVRDGFKSRPLNQR